MECPNCKTECLKAWKKCPECGVDLHKETHDVALATLRIQVTEKDAEIERLKNEKLELEKKVNVPNGRLLP